METKRIKEEDAAKKEERKHARLLKQEEKRMKQAIKENLKPMSGTL